MHDINNPGSRLINILNEAKTHPNNIQLSAVWMKIFGYKKNDYQKILSVQGYLIKLALEVEKGITTISHIPDKSIYLKPLRQLVAALYSSSNQQNTQHLKNNVTQNLIDNLQICSDMLNSNGLNEKTINQDKLSDLQEKTDSLFQEILKIDVEPELKEVLANCLSEFKNAITIYRINGIDAFKESIEKNFGALLYNKNRIVELQQKEETKEVISKIVIIIGKFNELIKFAKNTQIAIPYFADLLK